MPSHAPDAPSTVEPRRIAATASSTSAATAEAELVAPSRLRVTLATLGSLLSGGAATLGAMFVFRQGLLPLIGAAFHPGPDALSALRRTGLLLAALLGYWAFARWHEKRAATELRLSPRRLLLGAAGGVAMVGIPVALLFALGAYALVAFRGFSPALPGVAAVIVIAATLEELTCRALLFRIVERGCGTTVALGVQAVLFALMHLENVRHGGPADVATMLLAVTVLGLFWAGLFVLTRNLWVPVAHHAAWNFTILLSGAPLSGITDWRALAPLHTRMAGPDWLTGGLFGPESSLLVLATATLATAWLLRTAWRRGAFRAPVHRHVGARVA